MKSGVGLKVIIKPATQLSSQDTAKSSRTLTASLLFRAPKKVLVATSAGVVTVIALVVFLNYPPRHNGLSAKPSAHTFRHAVIDNGINPMNCMSGPWNDCAGGQKRNRR